MLSGRPALVLARMIEGGEVIELDRESLLSLVQTDSEIGEVIMRAFILRRVELIASGLGDVVLVGSSHCAGTLRVQQFLTRNGHPYSYHRSRSRRGCRGASGSIQGERRGRARRDLSRRGRTAQPHQSPDRGVPWLQRDHRPDYGARRGHRWRGPIGPGGGGVCGVGRPRRAGRRDQCSRRAGGSSSKIENYLGFPTGISGQELAGRAYTQAQKFGAHIVVAKGARELACARRPYQIQIDDDLRVPARTVIIASGAAYRRLDLENLSQFDGAGVYYGATFIEAQVCRGNEVVVVGGGNAAGQAAVFLAQSARHVYMLVRGAGLAATMSRYLIRRIEDNPAITLMTATEIVGLEGGRELERVRWRHVPTGNVDTRDIRHVFVMTGASPRPPGCAVASRST